MKLNRYALAALCLVICSAGGTLVWAGDSNLIKDAGFEQQLSPDAGGWQLFNESRFSSAQAYAGERSMFNFGLSRTVPFPPFLVGTASGSFQEFAATPGSRWRLTGFAMTATRLKGTPAFGLIQVSFFDADGKDLGTVETMGNKSAKAKTSNELNNQSNAGEWIFLDTGTATAPEGTATIQAFTLYVDYSDSNQSQGVFFDDLSLCEIDNNSTPPKCRLDPDD